LKTTVGKANKAIREGGAELPLSLLGPSNQVIKEEMSSATGAKLETEIQKTYTRPKGVDLRMMPSPGP